jgi:hypothetical protein
MGIITPRHIRVIRGTRRSRLVDKVVDGNLEITRREITIAFPGSIMPIRQLQTELRLIEP